MPVRDERRFVAVAFAVYAAATLLVALRHEPWRDEADAWLLLRDGGVGTMFARSGYIGMPALWYLLVAPLVKLGLPYVSMTILNVVIAWAAALLFLVAAPFPRWARVLVVFSYPLAYEYAVIARPYALLTLLLFAAVASWRRPMPFAIAIAFLANTTPHGLMLAAILGALSLTWNRSKAAIALMIVAGLLSVVQLWPPADAPEHHIVRGTRYDMVPRAIAGAFFPRFPVPIGAAAGMLVLAAVSYAIGRDRVAQLFLWTSTLVLLLIFTFVWIGGIRHAAMIAIVAIAALWLARASDVRVLAVLAWSAAFGLWSMQLDVRRPFSGAKEMALRIRARGLDRYEIAAHPPPHAEALLPYLPGKQFYYVVMGTHGTYMLWDDAYNRALVTPNEEAARMARDQMRGRDWLLLLNAELPEAGTRGYRLLQTNAEAPFRYRDERYWLYAPAER